MMDYQVSVAGLAVFLAGVGGVMSLLMSSRVGKTGDGRSKGAGIRAMVAGLVRDGRVRR
jgi:hypothetical protein